LELYIILKVFVLKTSSHKKIFLLFQLSFYLHIF